MKARASLAPCLLAGAGIWFPWSQITKPCPAEKSSLYNVQDTAWSKFLFTKKKKFTVWSFQFQSVFLLLLLAFCCFSWRHGCWFFWLFLSAVFTCSGPSAPATVMLIYKIRSLNWMKTITKHSLWSQSNSYWNCHVLVKQTGLPSPRNRESLET